MANKPTIAFLVAVSLIVVAAALLPRFYHPIRTDPLPATCIGNLRRIDGAKQGWAVAEAKTTNDGPTWDDIGPYLGGGPTNETPKCPQGGTYTLGRVGELPRCSIGGPSHMLAE